MIRALIFRSAAMPMLACLALTLPMGCGRALNSNPAGADRQPQTALVPLVTGKTITPRETARQNVGSMPMNITFSPDGRYLVTSDMGNRQALWSISAVDGTGISHIDFSNKPANGKSSTKQVAGGDGIPDAMGAGSPKTNGLYFGLAFAKDRTLYAAQGSNDSIATLSLSDDGTLKLTGSILTRKKDFPAGLTLDDRDRLYVANNAAGEGNPLTLSGSVAIYDPMLNKELGRYTFKSSHGGTSNFPLAIAVLHDGSKTYVTAERDDCVYVLASTNPSDLKLSATVATGAHPVALIFSRDQGRLYVANSLSDTISVIDTQTDRVIDTVMLRPAMVRDIPGVTPTALALSPDEKTLYVALGDMNAVALVDLDDRQVRGYVPTGWYPSALAVNADGRQLFVVNAKGAAVRTPNNMPDKYDPKRKHAYILSILDGNVDLVTIPSGEELKGATLEVQKNNRFDKLEEPGENPLAGIGLAAGKIKHVIYIIKENRTYDEVLGDLPQGNGDASLVLFGREVTPNQHGLAERFVLLDNLYACGEVSGDGWVWSTQGMADAYVIRNLPYQYSGRGRKYDFEGENNGYPVGGVPAVDEDGKPLANRGPFDQGAPPIPDVANTGRNLWDAAKEMGVSQRNYGFFLYIADGNAGLVGGPDNYPVAAGLQPAGHNLAGITDIDFRRFDLDYPDSDAGSIYYKQTHDPHALFEKTAYGKFEVGSRFAEWNREFQMMLAKDASGAAVPALMLVRLPLDHTEAAKAGKHTPRSYCADNDYAVGQIVEAISHSSIWESTAICVIEDDAQSGADHVDCHRTTASVISPWIRPHSVDHRFYNTDSMLKTMELLLGLKPLSQYDAIADPILDWDTSPSNAEPYTAILPSKELIAELNPKLDSLGSNDPRREMALESAKMDFTHADNIPSRVLNEINWQTVNGVGSKMPRPRGAASDDDD